jgi:hypothetical protein
MELPNEIEWNVFKYMSHPVADVFKKELEEELDDHYRILREGPCYEENWCADDDELFGYQYLSRKLSDNGKEKQMWKLHFKDPFMKQIKMLCRRCGYKSDFLHYDCCPRCRNLSDERMDELWWDYFILKKG